MDFLNGLSTVSLQKKVIILDLKYTKWGIILLRFGFGIILIASSYHKILSPVEFSFSVENYRIIGGGLSQAAAVWLPWLELITGLFLIFGIWLDAAVIINCLLMILFFILVLQAYIRGLDINCGCFHTEEEKTIRLLKIIENSLFMGFSILLLLKHQARD